MTVIDEKVGFYLRHWEQIEQWAALREPATEALDAALRTACTHISDTIDATTRVTFKDHDDEPYPGCLLDRPGWQVDGVGIALALKWHYAELFDREGDTWPYVGVHLGGPAVKRRSLSRRLRDDLRPHATDLRWDRSDNEWPWWRWIEPSDTSVDPEQLAADATAALLDGWKTLAEPIQTILLSGASEPAT